MSPRSTAWRTYRTIADELRARIADGELAPGALLPSESALCAQYGVARNTVRRAYEELTRERLIEALPGRGRVVAAAAPSATETVPQYRRMAAELRKHIESGDFGPGDQVPSESALADRYGVSRGTARHALAELEGAGLIVPVHGKGRFVREK